MRILTVTNLYPNPYQPQRATFNRQHVQALSQRHDVAVIAPIGWTDELRGWWKTGWRLPADRRAALDGLTIEHPRYYFPPKLLRGQYGAFYRRSIRKTFTRVVDDFQPEILYAPWAYPDGWAAVELGREFGLPVVVKVHGSDVLLLDQNPERAPPTIDALQRADGVVAVSRQLRDRCVELGVQADRCRCIYNGIDSNQFCSGPQSDARAALGLPADRRRLLFVGNLLPVKGVDVLIQACGLLAEQGVGFECSILGEGPLRGALEQQIRRMGLGDRIRLMGSLPHHELPTWFQAADVLVLPSHSEGVPTVLLEAASCGTPFVASHVGGIPEIAPMGIHRLVPPGDAVGLCRGIREILSQGPKTQAPQAIRPRSLTEAADEVVDFFQQILDGMECATTGDRTGASPRERSDPADADHALDPYRRNVDDCASSLSGGG